MLQSQVPRTNTARASGTTKAHSKAVLTAVGGLIAIVGVVALIVFLVAQMGSSGGAPKISDGITDAQPAAGKPAFNPLATTNNTAQLSAIVVGEVLPVQQPTGPAATNAAPLTAAAPEAATTPATPAAPLPAVPAPTTAPTTATGPTTPPAPAVPAATDPSSGLPIDLKALLELAAKAMNIGDLLSARTALNSALFDARLPANERRAVRQQMATINETLVYSNAVTLGDPLFSTHTVEKGENPTTIMRKKAPFIDRLFITRINNITNPTALRIGQRIKLPSQPFHAVVHKNDYRMDLFMGPPQAPGAPSKQGGDGQLEGWTYIRSFSVGLGESNGTPEGLFVVRTGSKLINPKWVNPRNAKVYAADDPDNPIGEHWIGLDGADDNTRRFTGYGVHGTIEPDSIGSQRSMGCVRMQKDDVAMVYEVLVDKVSMVWIIK